MDENNCVPEATKVESGCIRPISGDTVHKICSGQVVLSLAVAVKELVENALDAGATFIEVKLRNYGLEMLEVCDNGSGVEEHNLEAMTAKYHTSKIKEFTDLKFVETFGFRGEALSSLCALADMSIATRHSNDDVGTRIELDHNGHIKKRSPCALSVGTTVTLTSLFSTLPVRRRDFTRNIKKEFNKMCHILQAYCMVSKDVRILCSNFNEKVGRTVVMQTHCSHEVLANISSVFGTRQTMDLLPLKLSLNDAELTEESLMAELQDDDGGTMDITHEDIERLKSALFNFEGYISSCSHGAGRSSKDRQYFYVNSRPCDLKSVSKLINDVYHRYNSNQYPFIYLNILTSTRSDVDVNLTPDKRQVLINNEKILLLAVKKTLIKTFGGIPSTYKLQNTSVLSMFKQEVKNEEPNHNESNEHKSEDDGELPPSLSQNYAQALSQWKHTGDTIGPLVKVSIKRKCQEEVEMKTAKLKKIHEFLMRNELEVDKDLNSSQRESDIHLEEKEDDSIIEKVKNDSKLDNSSSDEDIQTRIDCKVVSSETMKTKIYTKIMKKKSSDGEDTLLSTVKSKPWAQENLPIAEAISAIRKTIQLDDSESEDMGNGNGSIIEGVISTSFAEIELNVNAEDCLLEESKSKTKLQRLRFKSEINPNKNKNAEAELDKEISKESFAQMDIIGQFNLGFIIVKLDMDLFIVDQHATDEKYNFEMLQRSTVLQHQPLAVPLPLELTAVNEMILLDNLEVFERNGFRFQINENAPSTRKVVLLGKPISRNWDFGTGDIDELIFMLQDGTGTDGTVYRPSRIRDMLASRACRKSVMIGKALNKSTMKTLIRHMGEIEHPWNCPHGRPTMRHLINTTMLLDVNDKDND